MSARMASPLRITLRMLLGLAVGAALLATTGSAVAQNDGADRLNDAARPGLAVGAVLHGYDPAWNQGEYIDIARNEFSAVTGTIYKGWNGWDDLDDGIDTSGWEAVVDWAGANNKLVHGHTLVYPLSTAASPWYTSEAPIDHEAVMEQYVTAVASSTAGEVWVWDVVNEVMVDPSSDKPRDAWGLRTDWIEYQEIGPDYVDKAFAWAKAADPNALLIINDYGAEELNDKSDNLFAYANELRRRGVPIDGVGFQMHWQGHRSEPNYPSIRANIARFADAGFKIFFTELDVMAKVADDESIPPTRFELEIQRAIYEEIARIATEEPAVEALLMWDYADDRSWLHPTIFDLGTVAIDKFTWPAPWTNGDPGTMLERKPAHAGLLEGLGSRGAADFGVGAWRLTSNWESQSSYLQARDGEVVIGTDGAAAAGEWQIEPAGFGFHRLRIGDQYLTRRGEPDGAGYVPTAEVELQALNEDWSSQLWRFEPEGEVWRIVNGWSMGKGLLTRSGVPDGNGGWLPGDTASLLEQNEWTSQRWTVTPVGSGGESRVALASSCLAENGRIDITIENGAAVAQTYEMRIGALASRFATVAPGATGGTTATGRPDGPLPVSVLVNGAEIFSQTVIVDCDPDLPEVSIAVSCLAGNGRIDTWLTNPLDRTVTYTVQVGYLADRVRSAAPGETVRVTVTGRQDREWFITVLRDGFTHYQEAVTVDCDP